MRNIIGNPAEGDDFFDRPKVLANLLSELANLANILLVAPRRVGKTSLVIRLQELWKSKAHQKGIFLNVEGQTDEFAFAERLIEELASAGLNAEILTRAKTIFNAVRTSLGGGIKIPGLDVSLGQAADPDQSTLNKILDSVFRKIEDGNQTVLIAIDELPEFLLNLQKEEQGPKRVNAFLHWLRFLRQTYRKKIRWLFLGSIGLDNFVEEQKLQKLINDLQVFTLDAFTDDEAKLFLQQLGKSNQRPVDDSECAEIIKCLGWPLAYHLQLVFHELRQDENITVATAFESLLQPQKLSYFETWRERIAVQFNDSDATACKAILGHLCQHPKGRERQQIVDALMARPVADIDRVEEQVSRLLIVLQRDGYLLQDVGRYAFRSFLLREYWRKRESR